VRGLSEPVYSSVQPHSIAEKGDTNESVETFCREQTKRSFPESRLASRKTSYLLGGYRRALISCPIPVEGVSESTSILLQNSTVPSSISLRTLTASRSLEE